jgi:hypothetical protein
MARASATCSVRSQRGQRGQGRSGDRLTHHGHGGQHELARVAQAGDHALPHVVAEDLLVPLVHREQRGPDHQRQRHQQVSQELAIRGSDPQPHAQDAQGVEQSDSKRPQRRAQQGAPDEALGSSAQAQPGADDGQVVDQRRGRLGAEASPRHERTAQDAAGHEEDLGGQHDPGEPHRERPDLGLHAVEQEPDQRFRIEPDQRREEQGRQPQGTQDRGHETLGGNVAPLLSSSGVERDEGDGERPARQQVVPRR